MRLGILGTGMIATEVLEVIKDFKIQYTSILSTERSIKKAMELAHKYKIDKCFTNYEEMLNDSIDTVYIALPNHLHFEYAKKALESNKNCIIEKPMVANIKEFQILKNIAEEKNLIILEAINLHHLPAIKGIKNTIDDLGNLRIISLNYSQYSSRYNAFKEGNILPAFDYKKAGGALMDINVYNVHFAVGLFGRPKKVIYEANIENKIDTSGILTLDYGNLKVVCIGAKDCGAPTVSTIQGEKGNIVMRKPVSQITKFTINYNDGSALEYKYDKDNHRLFYEFEEFINIIESNDKNKVNDLLEISQNACYVMETARKQQGIIFNNDL